MDTSGKPVRRNKLFSELLRFLPYKQKEKLLNNDKPNIFDKNINSTENFSGITISEISDLKLKLETDFYKKWETLKDEISIDLIEDFANELKVLYKTYKINILSEYIDKLDESTQSFDINTIKHMLNDFPNLINKVKLL
jgi:hypothetical protein